MLTGKKLPPLKKGAFRFTEKKAPFIKMERPCMDKRTSHLF